MANIDQMILKVQRLCGNHKLASYDDCLGALNSRHSDLLESFDWSRKKQSIAITSVPDKADGTISVTNGSPTVIGTGTIFTATDRGRYIKIGTDTSSLYVVRTVSTVNQFTLGDLNDSALAYPGPSQSGLNYTMFTRLFTLGAGIERVLKVKGKVDLTETSEEYLDAIDPWRTEQAEDAYYWAMAARDQTGTNDLVRLELYPRPSTAQIITALVLKGHTDLGPSQYPIVPSGPLVWYAAVDMCYELYARTKEDKWLTLIAGNGQNSGYNYEAEKSLEREKAEDFKKFGVIQTVKDAQADLPWSMTDAGITADYGD